MSKNIKSKKTRSKEAGYYPPLFKHYPELEEKFPRLDFGTYPTPVERLSHLGRENIWIKREDYSSCLYGGNKVRKLEFVLADALKKGCSRVITMGGIGTNHGLATSIFCREAGLRCRLLLFRQPLNDYVKQNMLLFQRYGAETKYLKGVLRTAASLLVTQRLFNPRGYILEPGGSSPLGTIGVVNAMFELKEQIDAGLLPEPRYLFCPLGSSGTMAGLSLGGILSGLSTTVIGVRVTMESIGPIPVASSRTVEALMKKTHRLMKKHSPSIPDISIPPQEVINDYVGKGYGCATAECLDALALMKEREGISLEPTYTAKTFAALLDFIKIHKDGNEAILYWHTYNSVDLSGEAATVTYRDLSPDMRRLYESNREEEMME